MGADPERNAVIPGLVVNVKVVAVLAKALLADAAMKEAMVEKCLRKVQCVREKRV